MYQHILVSTDGSKLSRKAIVTAVNLAKAVGARVTGVYVIPPYTPPIYSEAVMYALGMSPSKYRETVKREGKKALAVVEVEAQTAGVQNGAAMLAAPNPWDGIIRTAKAKKCDLIVMSSHGRRGLHGLLLGSETTKVLTHSKIPVLVCR
jgi:nucleotide-binding universal stress UspA family protein